MSDGRGLQARDGHPIALLQELCDLCSGITKGRKISSTETLEVPYMAVANVQDGKLSLDNVKTINATPEEIKRYRLLPGDLLLTEGGDPDKLGRGAIWNGEIDVCIHQNHIFRARKASNHIDMRYLSRLVSSPYGKRYFLRQSKQTTGIASINMAQLKRFPVPLPPLEEQRRIAAILDKANQLRQLSRGNLQTLDALVKKVFSDMFGDPISNERDWNSGCIGDFVAKFETGKSLGSGEGDVSDSLRIIKVSAVSSGDFKPEESKPAPKGYVPPPNHFVQEGDLLFCRANTDMLIGEVAYVGHGVQDLLLSDKIWRFCWTSKSVSHPLYVQQLFRHPSVRREIRRRATGTSGSMLNISQSSVLAIPIILPPADLQRKFQAIAAECRNLILRNTKQAISLWLLSCSLNRSLLGS